MKPELVQKRRGNPMEEGRGLFVEIYDQYENFAFKHDVGSIVFVVFFCKRIFI